jgi:RNA polymerase sigma factor (sigma-70 family)
MKFIGPRARPRRPGDNSLAMADTTRISLLARLRTDPNDQAAWAAFVERYGPQIYAWCRHFRLQEADAQDVTQNVLIKLARTLPDFTYDPGRSFRGWLRTITHHAWTDFIGEQQRGVRGAADNAVHELLQSVEARDDLANRLQLAFDQEILERAMDDVRSRVEPQTWEAFLRTAIQGTPATQVAAQLGMRIGTVYQARSNVQKLLREATESLNPGEPETSP